MEYSSSLSNKEWEIIEPLLPRKKKTCPPKWTKRQILDGIFYQLKQGCNWADLPNDLPPYSTVYWHYKQWRESGVLREIMTALHEQVRGQAEKKPKWTTLIIVDSQATKNTCNASVESKGFCSYKATNGIKRNLGVDSLGLPFFTLCTKASLSDDKALIEMFAQNIDYFKSKPVNIPKITVMVDHGYHPDKLIPALEEIYPQIMTKIRFKVAPKMSSQEKNALGISGFVVIPMRWIVERSNAWMERCKSLVKNFDRTLDKLMPEFIFALSGLCLTALLKLPKIPNGFYTTNAIDSMNSSLRKVIKSQQIFPSDESAFKLVYLAMRNISKKWTMSIRDWKPALNRFAILFEDRLHI